MQNIKLVVAYDGTNYKGWQKTRMGPSIESSLQQVLEQILQSPVRLQAASRTDAGVHAIGQVINFILTKPLNLNRLLISLNQLLPKDISVQSIEQASLQFHPTLDCQGKIYHYYLCYGTTQLPHHRLYSWHYPFPSLDLNLMREASSYFLGIHDFSTFCNTRKNAHYSHTKREITRLDIVEIEENRIQFIVEGNHFLYKMVRNLVGTLLYVGNGKLLKENIPSIIESGRRQTAGMTAPAHGLFLFQVKY